MLRHSFRSLLKTPVVTGVAVLSVALGIGANVAIFSVFDQMLLRRLPVTEPERLVNLVSPGPRSGSVSCGDAGTCDAIFSYPMFRDLERVQQVFTGIAAHREFGANIAYNAVSEGGNGLLVSGSYFQVRDVIGRRLQRMGRSQGFDIEIVGIAANSAYDEVKQRTAPLVLMPYRQDPDLAGAHFYVRTRAAELDLLAAIPQLVRDVDSTLPVGRLRTMTDQIHENVSLDRFVTSMSAAFATLATLLAALGLYGVLAYTVSQRTREFGLRMALGAQAGNVRRLVLRQIGLMTAVGAAIGLASAFALGRAAEPLLYQMSARDPYVFGLASIVLSAVALLAGFIPAQRAARVDPMTALRYE